VSSADQPKWAECYQQAQAACQQNDLPAVEKALKEGLGYASRDSAPDMDKGQMQFSLGWCYHAQGRLPEAHHEYSQALITFRRSSGEKSAKVGDVLHNLGSVCCDMKRPSEAQSLLLQALEIKKATPGEQHPDVVELKSMLAELGHVPAPEKLAEPVEQTGLAHRRRLPRGVVPTVDDLNVQGVVARADAAKNPSPDQPLVGATYVLFPVSLWKMAIMSWVTYGWYLLAWQYMNWLCVNKLRGKKEPEGVTVLNVVLFSIILIFPLLRRMRASGQKLGFHEPLPAILLAISFLAVCILAAVGDRLLPIPFSLGGLTFLPLLVVQRYANALNATVMPQGVKNDKLSGLNWLAIVIGGGLQVFAVVGFFTK